jgi:protease PrsW
MSLPPLAYALLGGIVPPIVWLWFWLHEDRRHPEPRGLIIATFLAGMAAVPLVLPLERFAHHALGDGMVTIALWALLEEVTKFAAVALIALRSRFFDEPLDALVYFITGALGFAALENVFFLFGQFADGSVLAGAITSNLRFIGATLLHTVASATIGGAVAFSFRKHGAVRMRFITLGVILAVLLHSLFNLFILYLNNGNLFPIFSAVWLAVVALIFFFERVKRLRRR